MIIVACTLGHGARRPWELIHWPHEALFQYGTRNDTVIGIDLAGSRAPRVSDKSFTCLYLTRWLCLFVIQLVIPCSCMNKPYTIDQRYYDSSLSYCTYCIRYFMFHSVRFRLCIQTLKVFRKNCANEMRNRDRVAKSNTAECSNYKRLRRCVPLAGVYIVNLLNVSTPAADLFLDNCSCF